MSITMSKSKLKLAPVVQPAIIPSFDYNGTGSATVAEIEHAADAFRARERDIRQTALDHAIRQGKLLLKVKDKLAHGLFTRWVRDRLDISDQTSRNYMNVATEYGENPNAVLDLPMAVTYRLSAPSTPQEIKDTVRVAHDRGEKVEPQKIAYAIDVAREKALAEKAIAQKAKADAVKRARKTAGKSKEEIDKIEKRHAANEKMRASKEAAAEAKAETERQERVQAAHDAVQMVKDRLGDEFATFIEIYLRGRWEFDRAVLEAA